MKHRLLYSLPVAIIIVGSGAAVALAIYLVRTLTGRKRVARGEVIGS